MDAHARGSHLRRAQYEQLVAECKALEDDICELKAETQRKEDILAAKQAARYRLAPVYSLPDEVWLEILETAFLHHFPHCGNPRSTFIDSPIAFSHVSRRFRNLALAFPSIWACIHINPRQSPAYSHMLQTQLLRSKDSPLSVTFICRGPSDEKLPMLSVKHFPSLEVTRHFYTCWSLLLRHALRWRHLSFWAEHESIIQWLLSRVWCTFEGISGLFPQLEHLDICVGYESHNDVPKCIIFQETFFLDTPKLSTLRLRGTLPTTLMLSNITRLSLILLTVKLSTLKKVLAAAAETLSVLVLNNVELLDADESELTSIPFTLPQLQHLALSDIDPLDICVRLLSFAAPKITLLEIGAPYPEDEVFMPPTVRSSIVFPEVKKLHLFTLSKDGPIPLLEPTFLEFFPVLEHIIIHEDDAALFTRYCLSALLQSLEEFERDKRQLPPLKKLWVTQPGGLVSEIEDIFTQIIRRKKSMGSPFDEALMLVDFSGAQELVPISEEEEIKQNLEQTGGGSRCHQEEEEDAMTDAWEYAGDDWLASAGNRMWEWQAMLDCPALPCWEPGGEVSWVRKSIEDYISLGSSDVV
ncbi:hypothetical protein EIP86_007345 [Pleurotus ostreatoroseus]|nr:hypothetical protein EIP86_007345 [Pleurotus ostreatoroseus]